MVCKSQTIRYLRNQDADEPLPVLSCQICKQFNKPNDLNNHSPLSSLVSGCRTNEGLLGNTEKKGVDTSTLQDVPVRIGERPGACLIIVTIDNEADIRVGSRILPMASKHNDLVEIPINFMIIRQWCYSKL